MGGVSSSIPSEQQQTHTNVDSSPNSPIPSDSNSPNPKMSDSDSKTPKTLDQDQDKEKEKAVLEDSNQSAAKDSDNVENKGEEGVGDEGDEEEEEEEEEECGFCVFMKGGGCKDSFVAWEKCIEEAEKSKEDIVDKCAEITTALTRCMEAHADYYEPILRAEKKAKEEVLKELEDEKEKEKEKVEIASN
ncbi:uncharacterized protein LOC142627150 [Castanea sativa]|uniref:uncharacterized protein LOC142627150 n=1 Tax=Castanea sativa TaxID=21020 RepID=UPI003F64C9AE